MSDEQQGWLRRFISDLKVVRLDDNVKDCAIALRLERRLKLPDAIVAATALVQGGVLYSNDQGFIGLPGVDLRPVMLRG